MELMQRTEEVKLRHFYKKNAEIPEEKVSLTMVKHVFGLLCQLQPTLPGHGGVILTGGFSGTSHWADGEEQHNYHRNILGHHSHGLVRSRAVTKSCDFSVPKSLFTNSSFQTGILDVLGSLMQLFGCLIFCYTAQMLNQSSLCTCSVFTSHLTLIFQKSVIFFFHFFMLLFFSFFFFRRVNVF